MTRPSSSYATRRADGSYQRRDHSIAIRRDSKATLGAPPHRRRRRIAAFCGTTHFRRCFALTALADETRLTAAGLHICSSLFVLTYPQRFEANETGFAVARQGIIASHPFHPIQKYHTYLANFTTFAGDSGGPVFVAGPDGHPLLV